MQVKPITIEETAEKDINCWIDNFKQKGIFERSENCGDHYKIYFKNNNKFHVRINKIIDEFAGSEAQ